MSNKFLVERKISIDAGHRVMTHGSKCQNIHGHTFTVHVFCEGPLAQQGEQASMVLDFGFLKQAMLDEIDAYCDHGFISSIDDLALLEMFLPDGYNGTVEDWQEELRNARDQFNSTLTTEAGFGTKLYVVDFVPTAENLARHWYRRLVDRVREASNGLAEMYKIDVWETPNCCASYPSI